MCQIGRSFFAVSAAVVVLWTAMGSPRAENFTSTNAADFQADLTAAATNDTDDVITLIAGTFSTAGNGDAPFLYLSTKNNKLTIRGAGAALTFVETNPLSPTNVLEIDVAGAGDNADVTVEGMTLRNAEDVGLNFEGNTSDLEVKDCDFIDNLVGLMFVPVSGSVKVANSLFQGSERGAVNNLGSTSTATYTNNVFRGNSFQGLNTSSGGRIEVTGNTFVDNIGTSSGAAILSAGPGSTLVQLTRNLFLRNSNPGPGGAVFLPGGPSVEAVNNIFSGNRSGSSDGGAVWASGSGFALFTNNTFTGNSAGGLGEAIFVGHPSMAFYNNIIFANFLGLPGSEEDILIDDDSAGPNGPPVVLSHNNIGTFVSECRENPACTENITETANISENPLFFNAGADDFHLVAGSPCIATGDAAAQALPALDFEGSPVNNPPDMGALAAVVTDIGVDRSEIDFGDIALEVPNTQSLTITNHGAAVLNVTGVNLSDAVNFAFGAGDCGGSTFSLASAESCMAQVTFMPTVEGSKSATLTLASNDPDEPTLVVNLSGVGVKADTGGGGGGGGGGGCALGSVSGIPSLVHFSLIFSGLAGLILLRRKKD